MRSRFSILGHPLHPMSNARVMATLHMVFNLVTVVLFLLAAVLMLDEGVTKGGHLVALLALHGTGVGLVAVSGVLGGEMVYRHHPAVLPGRTGDGAAGGGAGSGRPATTLGWLLSVR